MKLCLEEKFPLVMYACMRIKAMDETVRYFFFVLKPVLKGVYDTFVSMWLNYVSHQIGLDELNIWNMEW